MSWAWPFWKEPPESPLPSSWRSTTRHFTASWTWGGRAEAVDGQPAPRDRDARKVRPSPTRAAFQRGAALSRMHTGPRALRKGLQWGRGCSQGHRLICELAKGQRLGAALPAASLGAQPLL